MHPHDTEVAAYPAETNYSLHIPPVDVFIALCMVLKNLMNQENRRSDQIVIVWVGLTDTNDMLQRQGLLTPPRREYPNTGARSTRASLSLQAARKFSGQPIHPTRSPQSKVWNQLDRSSGEYHPRRPLTEEPGYI